MMSGPEETYDENRPILGSTSPRGSKIVYLSFMLLGLGTLLPWNFFITADSYWLYKLRNVTDDNYHTNDGERTYLQELYAPMLVCLSQITNFLFLFLNAMLSHLVHHSKRMSWSIIFLIILFLTTTAMVKINSDTWQTLFFAITMIIIILMNASGAVFQGGLVGLAGMFPESHMCAMVGGQSLGGVFASLARILSIYFGANAVNSAFIYFLVAVVVMVLTLLVYLYIHNTPYFHHYAEIAATVPDDDREKSSSHRQNAGHIEIFKQIWPLAISVGLIFLVTLSIFPVICVRIVSSSSNDTWKNEYFQPVITFLLFNVGDYIGRQGAGWLLLPRRGSKMVYVWPVLRLAFIPLLLFCNHEESSIPVLFSSDFSYIVILLSFSLSNGYFVTLCMMYAPHMVSEDHAEKAGGIMAAMLGFGLLLGAGLSFAFALI